MTFFSVPAAIGEWEGIKNTELGRK